MQLAMLTVSCLALAIIMVDMVNAQRQQNIPSSYGDYNNGDFGNDVANNNKQETEKKKQKEKVKDKDIDADETKTVFVPVLPFPYAFYPYYYPSFYSVEFYPPPPPPPPLVPVYTVFYD
ncbi:uncharacterized protein LOC120349789 [Nilaparvata lugens]|uniref:uncharacterized protein LOC120349789 n=1 Tax=Nilaparvata lugens TaxID=108931 RepID=UPI00193E3E14|nr:uncharacterized protein LOC120349789 [Nilaparvata lugens]